MVIIAVLFILVIIFVILNSSSNDNKQEPSNNAVNISRNIEYSNNVNIPKNNMVPEKDGYWNHIFFDPRIQKDLDTKEFILFRNILHKLIVSLESNETENFLTSAKYMIKPTIADAWNDISLVNIAFRKFDIAKRCVEKGLKLVEGKSNINGQIDLNFMSAENGLKEMSRLLNESETPEEDFVYYAKNRVREFKNNSPIYFS
jgi:hypothetical protein